MKIKLFLTFDHELPLGGLNASYKKALFDPTQKILDIADRYGIKVTLFSDILCAYRFKEWDEKSFYLPYKDQLQYAVRAGHDVQLHIHPHWLTTQYDGAAFLPSEDFALSDFKDHAAYGGIPGIIELSVEKLKDICMPVDKNYQCLAFRAGGYNIYPDSRQIFHSLYDQGICYDSSMAKGYYFRSGISEIDFRKLPDVPNWTVNPEDYHSALSGKAGILEIPIATIPKTPFEAPTRFKLKKYAFRAVENRGRMIHDHHQVDLISKIKMLLSSRMLSFDNHTLSLDYLLQIVGHQIRKYENKSEEIMFSAISHPKSMGDYSFELMDRFISSVQKLYPEVEFTTFSLFNSKTI
ncbi:MAG: hypothetical protein LBF05_03900 [Tannerella sp.]|jgi:hypothetical protein|nr:hypothetical protein [Tannerella sp.]